MSRIVDLVETHASTGALFQANCYQNLMPVIAYFYKTEENFVEFIFALVLLKFSILSHCTSS